MSYFQKLNLQDPQAPPPVPEVEVNGQEATLRDPTTGSEKKVSLPKTTWGAK